MVGRTGCGVAIRDDLENAGGIYVDAEVVRDGNLITSRNPNDLPAFCREIIAALEEKTVAGQWLEATIPLPDSLGQMAMVQAIAYDSAAGIVYVGAYDTAGRACRGSGHARLPAARPGRIIRRSRFSGTGAAGSKDGGPRMIVRRFPTRQAMAQAAADHATPRRPRCRKDRKSPRDCACSRVEKP